MNNHHSLRVLVTRPSKQAADTIQAITAQGHKVHSLPCLDIVAIDAHSQQHQHQHNKAIALNLDHYAHIIIISTNAAAHFLPLVENFWPQWPIGQTYWCMGQSTMAMLQTANFVDVRHSPLGETSEDLLNTLLPHIKSQDKVLIVRGVGGRETLKEALQKKQANVDYMACYQRQAPTINQQAIAALQTFAPQVVVLQSGETLANYHRLLAPHLDYSPTLIVPSLRVLEQAHRLGFNNCHCSQGASDQAICDILTNLSDLASLTQDS